MSRQQSNDSASTDPSPESSASQLRSVNEFGEGVAPQYLEQSSAPQSPQGVSSSSEGYPSWLPKRPPPPAPHSTIHSTSAAMFSEAGPSNEPYVGGRKATPRSVRIVSLGSTQGGKDYNDRQGRREPTDQSRAFSGPAHPRVWSRVTSAGMSPTLFSSGPLSTLPRPRFRSPALHLELLQNPSWKTRLLYYLFPVFVFAHIPLQTFFDFNAVFILLLVAKFPNPAAPGVPGSGRNWALGAAAYIACWFTWIVAIFVVYELVYSFYRRWRVKRPLMIPLYLSSPAFNLVSMTSFTNFCFMFHVRISAFTSEHGSLRDGLAETFYYYSQNLATVALLLPRAGLALALLLTFSSSQPSVVALADAGVSGRDGTFFRADGALTDYARGVLIANAAWTVWRALILLMSWVGLWIISGQGCAGLCGPRYRWEEGDVEKTVSAMSDNVSETDPLPWSWRESTVMRAYDAYEFCLTNRPLRSGPKEAKKESPVIFEGMDNVLAAVGLPSGHLPARRGVLSEDLFEGPGHEGDATTGKKPVPELSSIIPPAAAVQPRDKQSAEPSGPLMKLPYPFTGYKSQVSSTEVVPFPPSPRPEGDPDVTEGTNEHEDEEEEEDDDDDDEEEEEEGEEESEEPSSGRRTSGSMSSLGRPIVSRYPFQFRHPTRGSASSASHSSPHHSTPSTTTPHSTQSRSTHHSHSTQSTGNRESSDSPTNPSSNPSPLITTSFTGAVIPMPPRHPQRRPRAGTVPTLQSSPGSPSPIVFSGRPRARTRTESVVTDTSMSFGPIPRPAFDTDADMSYSHAPDESLMDVPEAEGSQEEAEERDSLGLLSAAPSPRTSLVNLRRTRTGSGTSRSSRSRTSSSHSRSESARSRAQSLIHSFGAASRSSLDLVRSRTHSMARLSDSPYNSASSDAPGSSQENHTFGHPLRTEWREADETAQESSGVPDASLPIEENAATSQELKTVHSNISKVAPSEASASRWSQHTETARVGVPISGSRAVESHPDISTADQSFVTAAATIQGASDSSGRTPSNWGGMEQYVGPQGTQGGTFGPA